MAGPFMVRGPVVMLSPSGGTTSVAALTGQVEGLLQSPLRREAVLSNERGLAGDRDGLRC